MCVYIYIYIYIKEAKLIIGIVIKPRSAGQTINLAPKSVWVFKWIVSIEDLV